MLCYFVTHEFVLKETRSGADCTAIISFHHFDHFFGLPGSSYIRFDAPNGWKTIQ